MTVADWLWLWGLLVLVSPWIGVAILMTWWHWTRLRCALAGHPPVAPWLRGFTWTHWRCRCGAVTTTRPR